MNIKIEATMRELGKKSDLNKFRREGFIPAVIYGEGQIGTNILLKNIDFQKQYKKSIGAVAIFELNLAGKKINVFIKDKQVHPVSREFVHVDFVELHPGKPITLNVPIHFIGVAKGTKEGGLLELLHHSMEISCLPKDIPEEIEIDVSNLGIGESIHFKDIHLTEHITSSMSDVTTLAAVRAPKKEEVVVVEKGAEETKAVFKKEPDSEKAAE
ncbi:MAG: 50S ribosomal protein L25 [Candidatus Cloacimonadales bacterium]|nr:50S ribosomal protein L25 [Candidatus Cloacimonadales bacterium]